MYDFAAQYCTKDLFTAFWMLVIERGVKLLGGTLMHVAA